MNVAASILNSEDVFTASLFQEFEANLDTVFGFISTVVFFQSQHLCALHNILHHQQVVAGKQTLLLGMAC